MKKFKIGVLYLIVMVISGCEGKFEPNGAPDAIQLLLPENNQQCLGLKLDSDKIRVEFDWDDVDDITLYSITYTDGVTDDSMTLTTSDSFISIDLEPGTLYTWSITVENIVGDSITSDEFSFYTEGLNEPNHTPFPAEIAISENMNGTIDISWQGSDLDDDIDYYQVFFGPSDPPEEIEANTANTTLNVTVQPNQAYFLNVRTFDSNGNFSDSKLSQTF